MVMARRRGGVLLDAIHAAVLDELVASGYAGLTIERVAERARTGKGSIYRRWPTRLDLVLDTLDHTLPQVDVLPDTGNIRTDLIEALWHIATVMNSPAGDAARACFGPEVDEELAQAIRDRLLPPRKKGLLAILRRGVARGEVRPGAVRTRVAEVGPMLLHGEMLQRGRITREAVRDIVDEVLMPLLRFSG